MYCLALRHVKGYIECTFRQTGKVTNALSGCEEGSIIGFRGPYGNIFPIDDWKGKNLLFIAGGIALATDALRDLECTGSEGEL